MRKCLVFFLLSIYFFNFQVFAQEKQPLSCHTGPVLKTFGETEWLVLSCNDNKTVVILTAKENPAAPFYFMFYIKDGIYKLSGEGTGNKEFTQKAFDYLSKLSEQEIEALIEQTKSH